MDKPLKREGIVRDDKAVALTECCIVMPVVLLFFLAILQYFEFVRAAQMVNYAAYVSARSYAVLHSQDDAKYAATMALAPVPGNINITGNVPGVGSILKSLSGLLPGGERYVNGGLNAYLFLTLGGFTVTTNSVNIASSSSGGGLANFVGGLAGGSPWQSPSSVEQVNVSINYPQFINIPGFQGLWVMLAGNGLPQSLQKIYYDYQMYQLANGLPVADIALSYLVDYGCVNIPAKCSTGYESWGNPDDYQKAVDNLKEYTSTFSQDDWDPNGTKWIPRQPSKSQ
jgi:hypothetical protein